MTKNIRKILERDFQGWLDLRDKICEPALNAVTSAPQRGVENIVEEYRQALVDLDHIEAQLTGTEQCDAAPPGEKQLRDE